MSYQTSQRVLHWSLALILFCLVCVGLAMVESLAVYQVTLVSWHKSFGVLVFILVLWRLWLRRKHGTPALPASVPRWQQRIAHGSHLALYGLMLGLPLLGWLMQNAAGRTVEVFGWFHLPTILSTDLVWYGWLRSLHEWFAYALILLVLLHVSAALQHAFVKRDGVFQQMWRR